MAAQMQQETRSLQIALEDLGHGTRATQVKVANTFNAFLNLSYYQYVENVRRSRLTLSRALSPQCPSLRIS